MVQLGSKAPDAEDHGQDLTLQESMLTPHLRKSRYPAELQRQVREESIRIAGRHVAHREALKAATLRKENETFLKLAAAFNESNNRWLRKTQGSPFAVDQLAESERAEEHTRAQERTERRHRELMQKTAQEARQLLFAKALAEEEADDLPRLRAEKRLLLETERCLRATRDVERKARHVQPKRTCTELMQDIPRHLQRGKLKSMSATAGSPGSKSLPAL